MPTSSSGSGISQAVHGGASKPPVPQRARDWWFVGAGVVAGLVAGLILGAKTDLLGFITDDAPAPAPFAVGPVSNVVTDPESEWGFRLPVFNSTTAPVVASLDGFEGAAWVVTTDRSDTIAAGSWGAVPFTIGANCDVRAPKKSSSVQLRIGTRGDRSLTDLPLPGGAKTLRDYHAVMCATEDDLVGPGDLVGVWMLEKVYGPDRDLVGVAMLRLGQDGSFAIDPQGGVLSGNVLARGTYRLEGEELTLDVEGGGYGCDAPEQVTWRVRISEDVMSMAWVRGVCPDGEPGDAWVMRRVLRVPETRD